MILDGWVLAIVIFGLRVLNYAVGTVRMVAITRNMRVLASSLAFVEALLFAVVIANVVRDLENFINLMAYCLGASAGSYVGMMLEGRLMTTYRIVNIITPANGHGIAQSLRSAGFGVTETVGQGRDGLVSTLRSVVNNRDLPKLINIAREVSPDAFIAVEEARTVSRGWMRPQGHLYR